MSANETTAQYLGMTLAIDAADGDNREYFQHCANGEFRLQCCTQCQRYRYPPGPSCPWCSAPDSIFKPVPTTGTVYSYAEVHHPIQPAFADCVPYAILIVELEIQRDRPNRGDAIRVAGNLADANGNLIVGKGLLEVGIGSRVKMVLHKASADIALPMWTLAEDGGEPSRYPLESPGMAN